MWSLVLLAQLSPIPRAGTSCPPGYLTSNGYCVPVQTHTQAIERTNSSCPPGTYVTGAYCTWELD